jgi:putative transposase
MVTPNQRRRVVGMLVERFGVSQRRACGLVGQARSTQRLPVVVPDDEEERLRVWLRDFSKRRPRWGWRRAADGLRRAGWRVNNKRVRRLWRDEGLRVVHRKRKKPLRGKGHAGAFCPIRPNVLWALDFQFDQTADARTLKLLNIIDEYTRECPAIVVDRTIDADKVVATLDAIAAERGAPAYLRFDNGPEFIAAAVADWCRFNTTATVFIEPGSPWQNAWIESFNGKLRDECLNGELFDNLLEARVVLEDWRIDYNMNRPHSSLGMLTPNEYADRWHQRQEPQPQLS